MGVTSLQVSWMVPHAVPIDYLSLQMNLRFVEGLRVVHVLIQPVSYQVLIWLERKRKMMPKMTKNELCCIALYPDHQ